MQKTKQFWLPLVRGGKQLWHHVLGDPFIWLFYCFFQPARFRNQFEGKSVWLRSVLMLRLALPLFLVSYPLAFLVQLILASSLPVSRLPGGVLNLSGLLLVTTWAVVIGVGWGMVGGIAGDIRLGIILGTAISIGGIAGNGGFGIVAGIATAIALGAIGGTILGMDWGMMGGILGGL